MLKPGAAFASRLRERRTRLRVVAAAGVAVAALLGGTVALLQLESTPHPTDDAGPAVTSTRPVSDDPAAPSSLAPTADPGAGSKTVPSPAPVADQPTTDPEPAAEPERTIETDPETDPATDPATEPVADPATEPVTELTTGNGRDSAPGQLRKPDRPTD